MVKLLLQESGTVRAFKLGDGVLRIGTGEQASLRVESREVAELHFELEVSGERATVRPMAGVTPPKVNGEVQAAESSIGFREPVQVGGVTLWIDADDSSSTTAPIVAAKPSATAIPGAGGKGPSNIKGHFPPVAKGPKKGTKANYRGTKRVVESQRKTIKRGLPNGVLIGGPLIIVVIAFMLFRKGVEDSNKQGIYSVSEMLDVVEKKLNTMSIRDAEAELTRIKPEMERSEDDEARIAAIQQRMLSMKAEAFEIQANLAGTKFLDTYLRRYEQSHLKGDPSHARIRMFMMRIKEFRERWPTHAGMEWIDRVSKRFESSVDLSQAPSFDDVVWEIKFIDVGENRNFKKAFALIAGLYSQTAEGDQGKIDRLKARVVQARDEHYQGRFDKVEDVLKFYDSVTKPVFWLLHLVLWCGDEGMAEKAAYRLISLGGADACLRGYEEHRPDLFMQIMEHPVIHEYALTHKIIE